MATRMLLTVRGFNTLNCHILSVENLHKHVTLAKAFYAKKPVAGSGAAKAGGKGAVAAPQRQRLQPETDPVKLTQYLCGGNIAREGGSDPELKPVSEYPDWLWTLRVERSSAPLDELDPDSWAYWKKLSSMNRHRVLSILRDRFKYRRFK